MHGSVVSHRAWDGSWGSVHTSRNFIALPNWWEFLFECVWINSADGEQACIYQSERAFKLWQIMDVSDSHELMLGLWDAWVFAWTVYVFLNSQDDHEIMEPNPEETRTY